MPSGGVIMLGCAASEQYNFMAWEVSPWAYIGAFYASFRGVVLRVEYGTDIFPYVMQHTDAKFQLGKLYFGNDIQFYTYFGSRALFK